MFNKTDKSHWEKINLFYNTRHASAPLVNKFSIFSTPSQKILDSITDRFFMADQGKKVLEIGCAPGKRLSRFAKRYGYVPYGVEYTESGIEATKKEFQRSKFPVENIFCTDVFDYNFQRAHKEEFDVVLSFGFIEHFEDVDAAIKAHLNFLKPGGLLLVMIPNLNGIYYYLSYFLYKKILDIHNLSIMRLPVFCNLFSDVVLRKLFCGYYGVINFGMLQANGRLQSIALKFLQKTQALFNPVWGFCHVLENRITSPYLLFIGRKSEKIL